ncbi:restriction endonuclease [Caenimonas soli]|uniref:restriction endonuclease n=1 Tax=Caenimonas soli TaxID=2735555 RepID=UPI001551A5DB|nr:restriction endonuclease [Caenimonas soli]NPC57824.1 restriction endonuclease [Caenimonas soli]
MPQLLSQLVTDWGGFERLVARLHDTGAVTVEHNVTLTGNSGTPRQIDVVVRHTEGLYQHLIIVECKYWKENVSRLHVDALATAVRDLGASRGVIFSASGFQEGAVKAAAQEHIELFKVRDLTDADWGAPGQVVEFYLQFYQASIGNLKVIKASRLGAASAQLNLNLGGGPQQSVTPTFDTTTRQPGLSLEQLIELTAARSLNAATKEGFTINGGVECTTYALAPVVIKPQVPIMLPQPAGALLIHELTYDLGIRIDQKPFRVDRFESYEFALIVEDCVRNVLSTASKRHDESKVQLAEVATQEPTPEGPVRNGSVLKIYLKGFFAFDELKDKTPVPFPGRTADVELSLRDLVTPGVSKT